MMLDNFFVCLRKYGKCFIQVYGQTFCSLFLNLQAKNQQAQLKSTNLYRNNLFSLVIQKTDSRTRSFFCGVTCPAPLEPTGFGRIIVAHKYRARAGYLEKRVKRTTIWHCRDLNMRLSNWDVYFDAFELLPILILCIMHSSYRIDGYSLSIYS